MKVRKMLQLPPLPATSRRPIFSTSKTRDPIKDSVKFQIEEDTARTI
jgi:hypothetical protein